MVKTSNISIVQNLIKLLRLKMQKGETKIGESPKIRVYCIELRWQYL